MLKVGSKRRRTAAQVKHDQEESAIREMDLQAKLARLADADGNGAVRRGWPKTFT